MTWTRAVGRGSRSLLYGIVHGLGWIVAVSESKLLYLDIHTFGNVTWDGVERPWKIR